MIAKFNNKLFEEQSELNYLHFDDLFEIDFSSNSIIFGFNGVGKSSICRFLLKKCPEQFYLIDYETKKEQYKTIPAGKKITLKPDDHNFIKANDEYEKAKNDLDLFKRIQENTCLSKTKLSSSSIQYFIDANKEEIVSEISLSKAEFDEINFVLKPVKKMFGSHLKEILDASYNANKEVENMQKSLVHEFCSSYINHLQTDENPEKCPVCHQDLDGLGKSLKEILDENIKLFSTGISCYFSDYLIGKSKTENEDFLRKLSAVITKYSEKGNSLFEYLLIDDSSDIDVFNKKIQNVVSSKKQLDNEKLNIEKLGKELSNIEHLAKEFYVKNFDFKEVKFDKKNTALVLTLPSDRDAKTYSQGELNLITLVALIIGASSSDKPNILIDDPLSSYDLLNQYKIMYEITRFVHNYSHKKITIFTHNHDALNIARQYNKILNLKYVYIEKYCNKLFSKELVLKPNVINIKELIEHDISGYLKANYDRENIATNKEKQEKIHKLFHYDDGEETYNDGIYQLSNIALNDLIEKWDPINFKIDEFEINTINKIKHLFSIRVFIEKKLAEINDEIKNNLISQKTFGNKLEAIETMYLNEAKAKYPNFDMDKLKGLRVLLNQNEHFGSQSQPYYYAINISLDDLIQEINTVKSMFK